MTIEEATSIMSMSKTDLDSLYAEGIRDLIRIDKKRLSRCQSHERTVLHREIEALETLLTIAK